MSLGTSAIPETTTLDRASVQQRVGAAAPFLAFALLLITAVYMTPTDGSWLRSSYDELDLETVQATEKQGDSLRQFAMAAVGLFGLIGIWWPSNRRLHVDLLGIIFVGYIAWFSSSWLWATDPSLSLRRIVGASCEVAAALALAKHLSPRQFVWFVLGCSLSWVLLGLTAELSLGNFQPWAPNYRFSGLFHTNHTGTACAFVILAVAYLSPSLQRGRGLMWAIALASFVLLYLTGSRTALGSLLATLIVGWLVTAPAPRVVLGLLCGVWLAALIALVLGSTLTTWAGNAISLGRSDSDLSSLTGRLPLWEDLLPYVGRSPFVGYGYNSFWTADRMEELSNPQFGAYGHAHLTFLELALNIGLIGAGLCLVAMLWTLGRSLRFEHSQPKSGYGFIAMLMIFCLISGLSESTLGKTWFLSLFATCATFVLMFRDAEPVHGGRFEERPDFAAWRPTALQYDVP
jgi:exopolysaccharide production protein ExoQ